MGLLGKQHSGLPPWPCYFIRILQLTTSIIVIYVIVWLHQNIAKTENPSVGREVIRKLETMWGWHTIFGASIVTAVAAIAITLLHILRRLTSSVHLVVNLLLLATWAVGFIGLWECTISHNILTLCDESSPCRVYNIVFACVCLALVVTSIAALLDVEVMLRRRQTKYRYLYNSKDKGATDAESFLELGSIKIPPRSQQSPPRTGYLTPPLGSPTLTRPYRDSP